MNNETQERFSKYKESLVSAWGYNDYNDWPIKVNSIMHLFLKVFAQEVIEDIEEIEAKQIENEAIQKYFSNPARFYRIIDPVIFGMKRLGHPIEYQRQTVLKLLDLVKSMKHGSEFNEFGENIILNPDAIQTLLKEHQLQKADEISAQTIQKFCGLMWAYTESIFFRAHEVTKEVHGCYTLSDNRKLVIREYLNLAPKKLWDEVNPPFLKYKNIQVYTVYNDNLNLTIDSYNHLFLKGGNYKDDMVEYFIVADGKSINFNELNELMIEATQTISKIHSWVAKQEWRTLANKYADIYWFRKQPFRKILGKESSVPEIVRKSINEGEPDRRRLKNLSEKEIDQLIKLVI